MENFCFKISKIVLDLDHMKLIINDYSLAGCKKFTRFGDYQANSEINSMENTEMNTSSLTLIFGHVTWKINREHLLSMGIHCFQFSNFHEKG